MNTLPRVFTPSFTPIVRFALHFLEMCVVMCVGGYAVSLAVFGAARVFGYPDLVTRVPSSRSR